MKLGRYPEPWILALLFGAALFYRPTGQEGLLLHNLALAAKARYETVFLLLATAGCRAALDSALMVEACLMTLALFCLLLYGTGFSTSYVCAANCVHVRRRAAEQVADTAHA